MQSNDRAKNVNMDCVVPVNYRQPVAAVVETGTYTAVLLQMGKVATMNQNGWKRSGSQNAEMVLPENKKSKSKEN
jgi:hypothetical protein